MELLQRDATQILIGKITNEPPFQYNVVLSKQYGWKGPDLLDERNPFTVQVERSPVGSLSSNESVTVVVRQDFGMRYAMHKDLLFFLKPRTAPVSYYDRHMRKFGDWRTVSDYFAVLEADDALEKTLLELTSRKQMSNPGAQEQPGPRTDDSGNRQLNEKILKYLTEQARGVVVGTILPEPEGIRSTTNGVRIAHAPFQISISRCFTGAFPVGASIKVQKARNNGGEWYVDGSVAIFLSREYSRDTLESNPLLYEIVSDTFGMVPYSDAMRELLTRFTRSNVRQSLPRAQ